MPKRTRLVHQNGSVESLPVDIQLEKIIEKIIQNGCTINSTELQLFGDGREITDLNSKLNELRQIPTLINVGRKAKHKMQVIEPSPRITNAPVLKLEKVRNRVKGYSGYVPGAQFGYGLPNSQLDFEHLKPQEDFDVEHSHSDPCLGYQGHVRGQQHVAGRTWHDAVQHLQDHNLEDLALKCPAIPDEIPCARRVALEKSFENKSYDN